MSRRMSELRKYYHQDLMNELNEMFIRLKVWVVLDNEELKAKTKKPTCNDLDKLMDKLMIALREKSEPLIKH